MYYEQCLVGGCWGGVTVCHCSAIHLGIFNFLLIFCVALFYFSMRTKAFVACSKLKKKKTNKNPERNSEEAIRNL